VFKYYLVYFNFGGIEGLCSTYWTAFVRTEPETGVAQSDVLKIHLLGYG
jgi:hypothetical protein